MATNFANDRLNCAAGWTSGIIYTITSVAIKSERTAMTYKMAKIRRITSPLSGGRKTVLFRDLIFVDSIKAKMKYMPIKIRRAIFTYASVPTVKPVMIMLGSIFMVLDDRLIY